MKMIDKRSDCRACKSKDLATILPLGSTPFANDYVTPGDDSQQPEAGLTLQLCRACSMVQLEEVVDPTVLYRHYAYVTSTSKSMDQHLQKQCLALLADGGIGKGGKVLEIASNTGVYLKQYQDQGMTVLGVEPAENIAAIANKDGVPTRPVFFDRDNAAAIAADWGKADLILGRHVFAHIDDLHGLIDGLAALVHDKSLVVFEVPYLMDFMEHSEYDTIYHEHLSYVSVGAVEALTADSPFRLVKVDHYPIHGGSIAFHLQPRSGNPQVHASVARHLLQERDADISSPKAWEPFAARVANIRQELPRLVRELRKQGERVIGYGAAAKGNTLINTCGLTADDLDYVIDNTSFKQGKLTPGARIPIVPPQRLLQDQPDYALLLAWNYADEIVGREQEFQQRGGRFIRPIPKPQIIDFPGKTD